MRTRTAAVAFSLTAVTLCAGIASGGLSWADSTTAGSTTADSATADAPVTASHGSRDPMRLVDRSPDLVRPKALTVDGSLSERRARQEIRLAQQLYTFWHTGRTSYLKAAVSPDFKDNTLPPGRPQGPAGPAFASKNFRAAVPDLTCELSDLLITGDKITARLVFRGTFTGTFDGVKGKGQKVEFNAIDIQHVGKKQIVEDWHIEDNQTLLAQLGVKG
ncbi:ester cyclase [Streptomyces sp. NPDC058579]|uniref:ester cyclase n=1 Tax=Streptomyces sp. NPDC058579 TaxID=3346548 RepID=UPI003648115F